MGNVRGKYMATITFQNKSPNKHKTKTHTHTQKELTEQRGCPESNTLTAIYKMTLIQLQVDYKKRQVLRKKQYTVQAICREDKERRNKFEIYTILVKESVMD